MTLWNSQKIFIFFLFLVLLAIAGCSQNNQNNESKNLDALAAENVQHITESTVSVDLEKNTEDDQGIDESTETYKEFTVQAIRFGYTPNTITVNKGDQVKITIENLDFTHGIRFPELEVQGDTIIDFTAAEAGQFMWFCNNYCGAGHGSMSGTLIVEE